MLRDKGQGGVVFPEYPGADLTEGVQNYPSSVDVGVTDLNAIYYFPTGATNLPMLTCIHGFESTAEDIGVETLRRWARLGYFVVAVEMRGSSGSGGNSGPRDIAGRECQDVYDAEEAIIDNFSTNLAEGRKGMLGFSAGGGVAWNMLQKFPDRYAAGTIYFGISDYAAWHTELGAIPRQTALEGYIGGDPTEVPNEYNTRSARLSLANIMCHVTFCHDEDDVSVSVEHSREMVALYVAAERIDYTYNESTAASEFRWSHDSPDNEPDLIEFEQYWKTSAKIGTINTVPTSGTLKVPGKLETKRFTIWMNDGNINNAGRSRYGTVVYDTVANTYEVTNNSTLDAVVCVSLPDGRVGVSVLTASGSAVISPITITIDGSTPVMWFDAAIGVLLDTGNIKIWADKTGGPQKQGYALRSAGALPALLATDLNSLPAAEFVAASTEYLEGERRRDIQGLTNLTLISVTTGAYIGQAANSSLHIQQALSTTSFFYVIANGGNTFGSYAGASAVYLVRSFLFDGSQALNAGRLVARENKVDKTLSFTGTIPATTENGTSVFRLGRRAYDTLYLGGKIAELMFFNSTLADVGDKEDILKAKYAI